jgi:hypothetical protein
MTAAQSLAQAEAYLGTATVKCISGEADEAQVRVLLAIGWLLHAIAIELGVPAITPAHQEDATIDQAGAGS